MGHGVTRIKVNASLSQTATRPGYCVAVSPPSRTGTCPVTKAAPGPQKYTTTPTPSPGSATRPIGMRSRMCRHVSGLASRQAPISPRNTVGATPLTVMP